MSGSHGCCNGTLLVAAACSFVTQLATAAALAPAIGGHAVPAAQVAGVLVAVGVMLRAVPALRPRFRPVQESAI